MSHRRRTLVSVSVLFVAVFVLMWIGNVQAGAISRSVHDAPVLEALNAISSLSSGANHNCAILDGQAYCWGRNDAGQIGDGTTEMRTIMVRVNGLGTVSAIVAGGFHTCAVNPIGALNCWGDNRFGQIGDGTTTNRALPVAVPGLGAVQQVTTGDAFTCALVSGAVKCWGQNNNGQLGDGTTTDRHTPVDVVGLGSNVIQVAAGGNHACALLGDQTLKCWGQNVHGQLGDGSTTEHITPVAVSGLSSVRQVSAGFGHTCAVTHANTPYCWGMNWYGQVGDGSSTSRSSPIQVSGLASLVDTISLGYYFTCAKTSGNTGKCWGKNDQGELGDNSVVNRHTPVDVQNLSEIASLGTGEHHSCARAGEALWCWGWNGIGQLGDGTNNSSLIPVKVKLPSPPITPARVSFLPLILFSPLPTETPPPSRTRTPKPTATRSATPRPTSTNTPSPPRPPLYDGQYSGALAQGGSLSFTVSNNGKYASQGYFKYWCPNTGSYNSWFFTEGDNISNGSFQLADILDQFHVPQIAMSCHSTATTQTYCEVYDNYADRYCRTTSGYANRK